MRQLVYFPSDRDGTLSRTISGAWYSAFDLDALALFQLAAPYKWAE
jgi:hypothetical protein